MPTMCRSAPSPTCVATRAAYQTGRLTNGGGGLASIPIIDYRAFNDDVPGGDIHVRYHSFSMREAAGQANGRQTTT